MAGDSPSRRPAILSSSMRRCLRARTLRAPAHGLQDAGRLSTQPPRRHSVHLHAMPTIAPSREASTASWPLLIAIAVFLAGVVADIELPGVYMDAVNPDYLVIPILHHDRNLPVWVLPGNYIANRYPVLAGGLYAGTQNVWLSLPLF